MKKSIRKYEQQQQLVLKTKTQPKLFLAQVRRNQHLRKSIFGLKDNEGETIFTPSAQAELLKDFYSSIFRKDDENSGPTLPVPTVVMPANRSQLRLYTESCLALISHKELVLITFTRRWHAGVLMFWLSPCLNYSLIPQQRLWRLPTGAWFSYAQYTKRVT